MRTLGKPADDELRGIDHSSGLPPPLLPMLLLLRDDNDGAAGHRLFIPMLAMADIVGKSETFSGEPKVCISPVRLSGIVLGGNFRECGAP